MVVFALIVALLALGVGAFAVMAARSLQSDVNVLASRAAELDGRLSELEVERLQRLRQIAAGGGLVGGGN